MTAARVAFDSGIAKLPEDQQSALLSMVENRVLSQVDDSETLLVSCPVCKLPALVRGATEETGWDVDYDKEGFRSRLHPSLLSSQARSNVRPVGSCWMEATRSKLLA